MDDWQDWIGRSETARDVATAAPLAGLRALLDGAEVEEGVVPPLAHWLYFLPRSPQSAIGEDGHPRRDAGSLLPPIDLPRRMWAGGRLRFDGAIAVGATIERRTTVVAIAPKTGRAGRMVFVTLLHEIASDGRVVIHEEQDIVYREAGGTVPAIAGVAGEKPAGARRVTMGPVALFRFSALTFNAHRIHYDRDYATQVEGYPGLVVHGPLIATLLLGHWRARNPGVDVTAFRFRAERPLFDGSPFDLIADGDMLTAGRADGTIAMSADVN